MFVPKSAFRHKHALMVLAFSASVVLHKMKLVEPSEFYNLHFEETVALDESHNIILVFSFVLLWY